jgi:inner membrane protein
MNPITHLLMSWTLADNVVREEHDRHLITWAGVLPDLDGLGAVADAGVQLLGKPDGWNYGVYHHWFLHGLPGALVLPALLAVTAKRRMAVFGFGFLTVHLHLACDIVGSRGPEVADFWPIWYFAPFSDRFPILWPGQWPVNSWPNVALTIFLMACVILVGIRQGHTVAAMFSRAADARIVETLRCRWARVCKVWRREA